MDSSRITLRPFKLSDIGDFFEWASDERVTPNIRWDPITSMEQARAHIENVAIPHPWFQSICLDDRSIGYIAFWRYSGDDDCRANIGYAIGADYWGLGIAKVALRTALSRVFKEIPGLVRIEAGALVENTRSQRALEKVGFEREGLLRKYTKYHGEVRDFYIFSFLATDSIL